MGQIARDLNQYKSKIWQLLIEELQSLVSVVTSQATASGQVHDEVEGAGVPYRWMELLVVHMYLDDEAEGARVG